MNYSPVSDKQWNEFIANGLRGILLKFTENERG